MHVDCSIRVYLAQNYAGIIGGSLDTSYELTGNDTRTCQSDGSCSGTDTMCRRGSYYIAICHV